MKGGQGKLYIAANPKMPATIPLILLDICKSLTIKIGSSPNVQSATAFNNDPESVAYTIREGEMQFLRSALHHCDMGTHWKHARNKRKRPNMVVPVIAIRRIQM